MWIDNKIVKEDLEYINSCDFIPWDELRNKTVFVTGTTGLIGQNLVNGLLYTNIKRSLNLKVIGLVRNIEKAKEKFKSQLQDTNALEFVIGDVRSFEFPESNIDYIVHGASITASKDFVEKPDEVKSIAIEGTKHLLELARVKNVSSFVYLSSMEVYGYPEKGHICTEDESCDFDPNEPRNSYPIAKLECEKLCKEYYKEYGISTKSIRLAQTFGPGIDYSDNRIFAQFARCVIENKDIVLHTKGETERCYLYTADAVTAILAVLLNGDNGETYNAANPETYCSIREMANIVANKVARGKISIKYNYAENYFLQKTYYYLSIEKISNTTWGRTFQGDTLLNCYYRTINYISNKNEIKEIIIVTNTLGNGGAQRVLTELIKEWRKIGIQVFIVQTDKYKEDYNYQSIEADYYIVDKPFFTKLYKLISIIKKHDNSVVLGFVNYSILLIGLSSFFIKNKIVFSERSDPNNSPNSSIKRIIRNILIRRADLIVFQTREAMEYHIKHNNISGPIITNPVSSNLPPINKNRNSKTFIACGRLDEQKNYPMMIKAFKLLNENYPDYHLDIYGRGNKEHEIIELLRKNKIENIVSIKGYSNNIFEIMNNSFAYLSSSNYEGISNSILEALSLGLPSICTDCPIGGTRDIVRNGINGILVKTNDHMEMYCEMKKIIEDEKYREKIAFEAAKTREQHSIQLIALKWLFEISKI